MLSSEQKKVISRLVLEASSYSNYHLNLENIEFSLRSKKLDPTVELWDYVTSDQYIEKIVSNLCNLRAELLISENIDLETIPSGRLLCFYPELSLKDAVVCLSSRGYIDADDCPPWDTWVCYSSVDIERFHSEKYSCLYSWVPTRLVDFIGVAIEEDIYDCLIWGEQLEKELGINKIKGNRCE